jgi:elongation factor G
MRRRTSASAFGRLSCRCMQTTAPISRSLCGDIAGAVGLKNTTTGDTLCDERASDHSRVHGVPGAGHSDVAVEPKTKNDSRKDGMRRWPEARGGRPDLPRPIRTRRRARPSSPAWASCIWRSSWTACAASSTSRRRSGAPQVAYRETIRKSAECEGRSSVRPAVTASTATCWLKLEPNRGQGLRVRDKVVGGAVPKEFIKPTSTASSGAAERPVAGYPIVDHESHGLTAATMRSTPRKQPSRSPHRMAFKSAAEKANPVLLEPYVKVEVTVPERVHGRVIGDLNKPPRPHRRHGSTQWCRQVIAASSRSPRCSAIRPTCVPRPRAEGTTAWKLRYYDEVPRRILPIK